MKRDRADAAKLRRRLRQSYGCACSGPVDGRVEPKMTNGILQTIEDWTGGKPRGCPWSAFTDPLVREVLAARPFHEKGTLTTYRPNPSHRLVEGLRAFEMAQDACKAERAQLDHEEAKRKRGRA